MKTLGGEVHNIWWYHDAERLEAVRVRRRGRARIDRLQLAGRHPRRRRQRPDGAAEVAFYHVDGAGTHNFSVDEANGVLYAAYYNGGVRAIDVRGDLGSCPASQQTIDAASGLARCDLRSWAGSWASGSPT